MKQVSKLARQMEGHDQERLNALRPYRSSHLFPDDSLELLVQLMTEDFHAPVATICFVGADEVFIHTSIGLSDNPVFARNISFCSLAILSSEVTVVQDARKDSRLFNHPLVQGNPHLCFFAAAPLETADGFRIGAVCIADTKKRKLTKEKRQQLKRYARCVMNDFEVKVTLQKKLENLEERELQLKQAYKLANIAAWELDVQNQKARWSDELYELYGLDKNKVEGDPLQLYLSLVHPEDMPAVKKKLQNPGSAPDMTLERLVKPNGTVAYIKQYKINIHNEEGQLVKTFGISQDISDYVAYEEQIRKSEERFKALVQNSSDMIGILDAAGTILYVSESCQTIIGYEPEELIGKNLFILLHGDDLDELTAEFKKVAENKNSGEPTLHRLKRKDGSWVWLESKGMNMFGDSHIGGLVINARDVTERVLLEDQLAKEQQRHQREITSAVIQAQETERSQLGRELHDNVNQVLTTIKLYNEMIGDTLGTQTTLVHKSGQLLQNCIDEIRSISKRLSAPTLGEISIEDSIKELIGSINLTNKVEIIYTGRHMDKLHIPQELHLAIYRIIQEQLNNILKYAAASLVHIILEKKGLYLTLRITDNGKGFETTAKRNGIGITNMQTRAENLGGTFVLKSSPGQGCQLVAQFPLEEEHSPVEA